MQKRLPLTSRPGRGLQTTASTAILLEICGSRIIIQMNLKITSRLSSQV